ncbi:MAG: helix-turn-helix transcriptional regulator [Bacteroides sp.]|nr:helix-turn-helix transcriptional regulator [Bacteroides sp.]
MNGIPINIAFGKRLSDLRKATGLSQEAFAFKCGMDRTYIGIIERGEKSPTLNTLNKIANGLNITLSHLMDF